MKLSIFIAGLLFLYTLEKTVVNSADVDLAFC